MATVHASDVTIGVPVFNEARFVEATVRSAVGQCRRLVLADNASTDGTADICRALAREYANIELVEHPRNLGALHNFRCVLDRATTPYFMWLGGHDMLPPDYVETLAGALAADPEAVLAFGDAQHIDTQDRPTRLHRYPYAGRFADADPLRRLQAMIHRLSNMSIVHGVFRTQALHSEWEDGTYLGVDNVYVAKLLRAGKFLYLPQTHLLRRDLAREVDRHAQLERIAGQPVARAAPDLQPMLLGLHAQFVRQTAGTGVVGAWHRAVAWGVLVSRHGPFGAHAATRVVAYPVFALLRAARWVKRLVFGKARNAAPADDT
jgi:hypothetical protein